MDPEQFNSLKIWLVELTNVSRDALHIHIGIALFLLIWLLIRRPWAGTLAWMIVLAVAVYGETLDHAQEVATQYHYTETEHRRDVINTMIWPTLLLFLGWFMIARSGSGKAEKPISDEQDDQPSSPSSGDLPDESRKKPPSV